MSPRLLELALKKQRLQFRCDALRQRLLGHARGLAPVSNAIDRIGEGVGWARRHPHLVVAFAVAMFVARPRAALRWVRRGFFAWQAWRKGWHWLLAGLSP